MTVLQPKQLGLSSQVLLSWDSATMPCHRCKEKEKEGCSADLGLRTTCVAHGCFLKVPASTFTMSIYKGLLDFLKEPTPFLEKIATVQKRWKLSTATLFLLCNLISSSSERAGGAIPTVPALGVFLSCAVLGTAIMFGLTWGHETNWDSASHTDWS